MIEACFENQWESLYVFLVVNSKPFYNVYNDSEFFIL